MDTREPWRALLTRARTAEAQRQVADALLPNAAFLIGHEIAGPAVGVGVALAAALALALARLVRRQPVGLVAAALGLVLLHAGIVMLTGEGRDFFLSWLLLNGAGAVLFGGSLLVNRPITERLARFAGDSPRRRRSHRRVTAWWTGFWVLHLVVAVPLYVADRVVALGVAHFVLGPPLLLVLGVVTWRILAAPEAEAQSIRAQAEDVR